MNYNEKALLVGMIGDILLQIIVWYRGNFAGLQSYFQQHGHVESIFIAGGMLAFFGLSMDIFGITKTLLHLAIVGALLDILFRTLRIFPSLDEYYKALNMFQSILWGIIPMILPTLF